MSKLLIRPHEKTTTGEVISITPDTAGWSFVGLSVYKLHDGQHLIVGDPTREVCVVIVTGKVSAEGYGDLGGRASVTEDAGPAALYLPQGERATLVADGAAEVAICSAPGGGDHAPRVIQPDEFSVEIRGEGSNMRRVRNILPESAPAHSLLVVEVITPPGNWSSYPPHKHDSNRIPQETYLEEVYYHRIIPGQGFVFQRVYTDDRSIDETMAVHDGEAVLVPRGYHPVGAPYGYTSYYLNVMAGPTRRWIFQNDPAHEWMLRPETLTSGGDA